MQKTINELIAMEENIERFERIRSYIKGEMSIEERVAFERDLLHDKELAKEFEEIEGISKATVKVYEEEQLQKDLEMVEREMAEADQLTKSLHTTEPFYQKVKQWLSPLKTVISLAVAASLALGIFLPVNNHHLAVSGYEEANRLLESGSWQFNTYRSDDVITDKMDNCFAQIHEGKFEEALNSINETEAAIEEQISSLSADDSAFLRISELERAKQELEWHKAVLLMHDKKVGKAKRLLKLIAKSDNVYSGKARIILKEIY